MISKNTSYNTQAQALNKTDVSRSLHPVLVEYKKWKEEHDEDYCYDEIHEFFTYYSRGDMQGFMEWCLANCG